MSGNIVVDCVISNFIVNFSNKIQKTWEKICVNTKNKLVLYSKMMYITYKNSNYLLLKTTYVYKNSIFTLFISQSYF